jgi:ATP-dependent DNA helicase RecG
METPLATIIGDRSALSLKSAFGYTLVGDLLTHYPRRYATRGELTSISGIPLGEMATLVGEVVSVSKRTMKAKRGSVLEVVITDGTGLVTLTFFNQAWRANDLVAGARGIFAGKVGIYRSERQLTHPDYELFEASELSTERGEEWAKRPIPLYPATQKVASWQIAKAVGVILDVLEDVLDPVPEDIRVAEKLIPVTRAYELIHRPQEESEWQLARDTLRFHEAFVLQCALVQRRAIARSVQSVIRKPGALTQTLQGSLPFSFTDDQEKVNQDIRADLATGHPMNRLVQGEVGSGKTVVALMAMVTVAESGGQTAFLAPTEVLAWQHFRSLQATLGPALVSELKPTLLTGALSAADKKRALLLAASGASRIVVGTHALLSDTVQFADLGLVVIDEQHRFGVDQRDALRQKGTHPHVLVLTATPIPRTVAMTVFGDLDISTIRNLPQGRQPILTHVVALADQPGWYPRIWERLAEEVRLGRQGFVVAPAISPTAKEDDLDLAEDSEEGPSRPLATVLETLPMVQALPQCRGMKVAAVHGQMPAEEKDAVMQAFAAGEVDILVATTVIEVGIDVPNSTAMVILDANRFGVSQLHQLRGRVGRGAHAGVCLLVTHCEKDTPARARVDAVAGTLDGFELAKIDLELRSEGDVLGTRQSGRRSSLTLVRVTHDGELIDTAREYAEALIAKDSTLDSYPGIQADIHRRLDDRSAEFLDKN